MNLAEKV
ncbi:hypothetical protein LINPERPRIM_LOCUS571 [Linum perenne]